MLPVLDSGRDMRPLAALERFLERLFERPGARLFRPAIRPIQIQRQIERAMEHARQRDGERVVVPSRSIVRLHPSDLAPDVETSTVLASELADAVLRFARDHRYVVAERPTVELVADPRVRRGEAEVTTSDAATRGPLFDSAHGARLDGGPGTNGPAALREDTARYPVPHTRVPSTILRSVAPDGRERRFEISTPLVTIGRATDNQLVLDDRRASRHHARLTARAGGLVFTDLDSTNGSVVNGKRVREVALGPGDRIELGKTVLFVESVGAPTPGA